MNNSIETIAFPEYSVCERRMFKDLREISITKSGILINKVAHNGFTPIDNIEPIISSDNLIFTENNELFITCINLGKYMTKKPDIIDYFSSCYYLSADINIKKNISFSLLEEMANVSNISNNKNKLNYSFKSKNTFMFKSLIKSKYANDKKLKKLLIKWLEFGGIAKEDIINDDTDNGSVISNEAIVNILKFSLEIYNEYEKIKKNGFEKKEIKLTYILDNVNGKFKVTKVVDKLYDMVYFMMVASYMSNNKSMKCCRLCGEYFYGRKNRIYCSTNCKDKNKYLNKKLKKKNLV